MKPVSPGDIQKFARPAADVEKTASGRVFPEERDVAFILGYAESDHELSIGIQVEAGVIFAGLPIFGERIHLDQAAIPTP